MGDLRELCVICDRILLSLDSEWAFYSCGHFACFQCYPSWSQNCPCGAGYYLPYLTIGNEDLRNLIWRCLTAKATDQLNYRTWMEQLKNFISQSVTCPGCNFYISPFALCPNCPPPPPDWMCPKCQAYSSGLSWECIRCQRYTNLDLVPDDFPLDELPEEKKADPDSASTSGQLNSSVWLCRNCKYEYNIDAKCQHCDTLRDPPKIAPHQPASLPSEEGSLSLSPKHGKKTVASDQKPQGIDSKPVSEEDKASFSKAQSKSIRLEEEQSKPPAPSSQTIPREVKQKAADEAKQESRREWTCACGMKNNCFADKCQRCSRSKQGDHPPVEIEEAKTEPAREPWDCPSCTYKGVKGQKCQICGANRPQPRSLPPANQKASQPINSIPSSSDVEATCSKCGKAQPCSCTQSSQSLPSVPSPSKPAVGKSKVRPVSKVESRTIKVVPAKNNASGTQWICGNCEFKSNMIGSKTCHKCGKAKK